MGNQQAGGEEEPNVINENQTNQELVDEPTPTLKLERFENYVTQFFQAANKNNPDDWKFEEKLKSWNETFPEELKNRGSLPEDTLFCPQTYESITHHQWIYLGQYYQGKRHGRGRLIEVETSTLYDGYWQDHQMISGRINHSEGDYYEGQLSSSPPNDKSKKTKAHARPHGKGFEFCRSHGHLAGYCEYKGEYVNGIKHGNGELHFPNGDKYNGQFILGKFSGTGSFLWGQGQRYYQGEWSNNQMSGSGKYYWGCDLNDLANSKGTYIGQYLDGKKHGHGVLRLTRPWIYEGNWANGVQDGKCSKFVDKNGDEHIDCNFVAGKLQGICKIIKKKDRTELKNSRFEKGLIQGSCELLKPGSLEPERVSFRDGVIEARDLNKKVSIPISTKIAQKS